MHSGWNSESALVLMQFVEPAGTVHHSFLPLKIVVHIQTKDSLSLDKNVMHCVRLEG